MCTIERKSLMNLATFGHDKTHKKAIRSFQTLLNDRNTPLLSANTRKVLSFTCVSKSHSHL
jgi:hypothetical protein